MAEEDEHRSGPRGRDDYDVGRLLALSDGVFAIAMTLLVLDLPVPRLVHATDLDLLGALQGVVPNAIGFAVSFVLVGTYWIGHRALLRGLVHTDALLVWLNLFLLLLVCVVPFTAGVMSSYGNLATAVVLYATNLALLSALSVALRVRTWHGGLLAVPPSRQERRAGLVAPLMGIVIFGGSIPIATQSPTLAEFSWLLLFLTGVLSGRWRRRRR
jgi:uncharacterized membrane protein